MDCTKQKHDNPMYKAYEPRDTYAFTDIPQIIIVKEDNHPKTHDQKQTYQNIASPARLFDTT